ncbi:glycoside hydrolase [Actinopolyspora mortivallis]|uniref:Glycoside hydrolase n=1 Tax=Actinopolyspora mortivallis TaxID=33906 RepID=A0A2T0H1S5_ACTMO|nr:glycoside hydrolase [Actinopolyspora mortivallis]
MEHANTGGVWNRPAARRSFLAGTAALLGTGLVPTDAAARRRPESTGHWRPLVRFTPESNWMNDPNGLVHYRGEYHLFFQHNPHGIDHANMSWGHAVSTDLVHWRHLPVALRPDELGEIFSGSAVVDEHDTSGLFDGGSGIVAYYTSAGATQTQSLAYSADNGRTWTKYPGNPVVDNPGFADFRDPKVIRHEPTGTWVLLLAAGDRVLFYSSTDLLTWTRVGEFGADQGAHGGVWECPDLFELPVDSDERRRRWVLVVSINPGGPAGGSATQYFVGDFDGRVFVNDNTPDRVLWADHGADFYACQSWYGTPGRRLWLGWMSNWNYAPNTPTRPWRGTMTVPREVGLTGTESGPRLVQRPAREVELAHGRRRRWRGVLAGEAKVPRFRGKALDISADFEVLDGLPEFGFDVFLGPRHRTRVGYDARAQTLFVDRTDSGEVGISEDFPARHETSLSVSGARVRLRILLDHCGVEVFGDDGSVVLTDLVFPSEEDDGGRGFCSGGRVLAELEVRELRP